MTMNNNNIIILILEIIFVIFIIFVVALILKAYVASKKIKRISHYSIEPIKDNSLSFTDRVVNGYLSFVKYLRPYMKKVDYFKKRSKRYDKYIKYKNRDRVEAIDFIISKFVIAFAFLLLAIFSQIFNYTGLGFIGCFVNFFTGYFILDVYYYFYYKRLTKLIENELLRAVIVMNNAFKAGKSTLQAIEIASVELPEPICDEFKKMYLDMKFGLSVDTVFDRFAKRVKLEEAVYLSSSLTILNKTGGNIIEVFSSIERTLFDKKKLNEELKNISSAPKMVIYTLFAVPIIFVVLIYFLNNDYFKPLFSSTLGYIILSIIVIMFSIYVFLLRRILRIEVE